mmetsp:Transcript_16974/g.56213  ORF Transcript_16974/g.56213 Transcript_16974/m.56213 type:complete len:110 (-) Transcript_16974:129-458(-)
MILRELKMLQHFSGHDNIVSLVDVFIDGKDKHLYFVTELMDTSLHSVIYSKQPLTVQHRVRGSVRRTKHRGQLARCDQEDQGLCRWGDKGERCQDDPARAEDAAALQRA